MTRGALRLLTMNVTQSCEASCLYCHWWRTKTHDEPIQTLFGIVDQAAWMGVTAIRISGGEPTLRPDLPRLIAHIREAGLASMLCTAASCSPQTLLSLTDAGLDVLSVSMDTLRPVAFHRIRGYDIGPVLENLEHLAHLRSRGEFEIVLSVVLTRLSLEGLVDLLRYARVLDLVVSITPFQGLTSGGSSKSPLCFTGEDEPRLRQAIRAAQEEADQGTRIINADGYLDGAVDFLITRRPPLAHVCCAGDTAAIRLAGGELRLCHSLEGIQRSTLDAAWRSEEAEALRARMARLDCPGCWLSCHSDPRRTVARHYGRPEMWEAL